VSVAPITTVPGAACTLVVSRVGLAVGPFVGPCVLSRCAPAPPSRWTALPSTGARPAGSVASSAASPAEGFDSVAARPQRPVEAIERRSRRTRSSACLVSVRRHRHGSPQPSRRSRLGHESSCAVAASWPARARIAACPTTARPDAVARSRRPASTNLAHDGDARDSWSTSGSASSNERAQPTRNSGADRCRAPFASAPIRVASRHAVQACRSAPTRETRTPWQVALPSATG
jgi:hypothetical protein